MADINMTFKIGDVSISLKTESKKIKSFKKAYKAYRKKIHGLGFDKSDVEAVAELMRYGTPYIEIEQGDKKIKFEVPSADSNQLMMFWSSILNQVSNSQNVSFDSKFNSYLNLVTVEEQQEVDSEIRDILEHLQNDK